jgi:hypothetical protein
MPKQEAAVKTEAPKQEAAVKTEAPKQEAPVKTEAPEQEAPVKTEAPALRRRRQPVRAMNDPRSARKQANVENDQSDQ